MSSLLRTLRCCQIAWKQGRVALVGAVATLLLLTGCEGSAFEAARAKNTVQAYTRYLHRYRHGAHRRQVLDSIDDARFRQALRGGGVYAYRLYLRQHGRHGRHAPEARRRLAELALSRAKDVAALTLVIERYPGRPEARLARKRLADLEARRALHASDPAFCERFLRRYPGLAEAKAVRERLAGMRFAQLGSRALDLEAFLQRFAGTSWAAKASWRLRQRLRAEFTSDPTPMALARLAGRFPGDPELGRFRRLVRRRRFRESLLRLDAMVLASAAPPEKDLSDQAKRDRALAAAVKALCDKHARRCDLLRTAVDRSLPWRPRAALSEISGRIRAADLQEAWRALEEASWLSTVAAGDLLAGELRSGRLGNVWPAARALRSWIGRIGARLRRRWIQAQMAHKPHVTNRDEVQRYGFIAILAERRKLGDRLLRGLLGDRERRLVAAALLTMAETRPAGAVAMLQGAASRRLLRLTDAFPKKLSKASAGTARLVERELFVLLKAVEVGLAKRSSVGGDRLRQRIRRTLLKWRAELGQVDPSFHPAAFVDLSGIAMAHAKGREAALRRLLRGRGAVVRAVSRAVCEHVVLPSLCRRCQAAGALGDLGKMR